jgi:hypothetical protein
MWVKEIIYWNVMQSTYISTASACEIIEGWNERRSQRKKQADSGSTSKRKEKKENNRSLNSGRKPRTACGLLGHGYCRQSFTNGL